MGERGGEERTQAGIVLLLQSQHRVRFLEIEEGDPWRIRRKLNEPVMESGGGRGLNGGKLGGTEPPQKPSSCT